MNYLGFIKIDTLDRSVYPRSGFRFFGMFRAVTKNLITKPDKNIHSFEQITVSAAEYIPVYKNITLFGSFSGGATSSSYIPGDYSFYLGGAEQMAAPYDITLFPFLGRNFMELSGPHAIVTLVGIRYEFQREKYLTFRLNRGKISYDFEEIFSKSDILTGMGMTVGILSPIGPMEYTLMWESEKKDLMTHVNVGYTF